MHLTAPWALRWYILTQIWYFLDTCREQSYQNSFYKVLYGETHTRTNCSEFKHVWHWSVCTSVCTHTSMCAQMQTRTHTHNDCSRNWVVQFSMVSMHLSEVSPTLPLKWFHCSSEWWWPSRPFKKECPALPLSTPLSNQWCDVLGFVPAVSVLSMRLTEAVVCLAEQGWDSGQGVWIHPRATEQQHPPVGECERHWANGGGHRTFAWTGGRP